MSTPKNIQKEILPLKESASMILFENPSAPSKILMLKRIAKISFGNAVVFPGGACDKEDKEFTKKYVQRDRF
jgi:8-oxo-dGTP pyrophosphatase MutT (NUDIX family)